MPFWRKYKDEEIIQGLCSNNLKTIAKWQAITYDFFLAEAKKISIANYSKDKFLTVYQDSIQSLMKNIVTKNYKGESSLKTYFTRIFKNKAIDADRAKKTIQTTAIPDEIFGILSWDGQVEKNLTDETFKVLLSQLKDVCRKIIPLSLEGYQDKDIAIIIGKNKEAVKKSRQSCFKKYQDLVNIHIINVA